MGTEGLVQSLPSLPHKDCILGLYQSYDTSGWRHTVLIRLNIFRKGALLVHPHNRRTHRNMNKTRHLQCKKVQITAQSLRIVFSVHVLLYIYSIVVLFPGIQSVRISWQCGCSSLVGWCEYIWPPVSDQEQTHSSNSGQSSPETRCRRWRHNTSSSFRRHRKRGASCWSPSLVRSTVPGSRFRWRNIALVDPSGSIDLCRQLPATKHLCTASLNLQLNISTFSLS